MDTPQRKSAQLRRFADEELLPSPAHTTNGNKCADDIFNLLRRKVNYVDRVIIAGSSGKRTAVGDDTDFDLVVFCNGKHPPYNSVLDDFERVLGVAVKRRNAYMVHFEMKGFSFDLCPATNFIPKDVPSLTRRVLLQRELTLSKMGTLTGSARQAYSTSLAESAVDFLKTKSAMAHSFARLAKFWNKSAGGCLFPGRKLLIETLAVDEASKAELAGLTLYHGFVNFLTIMKTLSPNQAVIDPANPFNDIMSGASIDFKAFRSAALRTLESLDKPFGARPMEEIIEAKDNQSCTVF